jgi:hypothetical protein
MSMLSTGMPSHLHHQSPLLPFLPGACRTFPFMSFLKKVSFAYLLGFLMLSRWWYHRKEFQSHLPQFETTVHPSCIPYILHPQQTRCTHFPL